MVEKDFRSRLRRLFSAGAVIRSIGGKKLKVVDTDELQMWPKNSMRGRYSAIHRSQWGGNYREHNQAYQAVRNELFRDYEAMDNDGIISSALDIYADEATVKNEFGDLLTIHSSDENIKKILENLFYDIMNLEFNLWPWVRNLCKYGDMFLSLDIKEGYGVINVTPLSAYEVIREEGFDPELPKDVRFIYESPMFGKHTFQGFEVAHFRLLSDSNFVPYGKGVIENARRVWKQLCMMEDAMMIHRIMRAPEKRVFKIDVGNIPPSDVDAYIKKIQAQIRKVPYLDDRTGEYNLKFNMQNMIEDFMVPVRGGDSGTSIENLPGLEYQAIEDIDYLKNKLFAALKIPKAFMNYEEDTSGKATLAAVDMRFARTVERVQKTVISELVRIAIVHLYSQGYTDESMVNFSISLSPSSTVYEQEKIRIWQERVALAVSIKESKLLSEDWIYDKIFNVSNDEVTKVRDAIIDDIKRAFRFAQIETEGNDPAKSGQLVMGGQAIDPFADQPDQDGGFDGESDVDREGDEFKKGGRPKENSTKYRTDKHIMGRDPIGSKTFEKYPTQNEVLSIIRSIKPKKKIVTENTDMLDETNLLE